MKIGNLLKRQNIDWLLFFSALPILGAGLVTMNSFVGDSSLFDKQIIWIAVSLSVFFILSFIDFRFLRRTEVIIFIFIFLCALLFLLFILGVTVRGSQSWFQFGSVAFQPSDLAKLVTILILAKYFTRRHIEIARLRHILLSGFYALVIFALILLQPDFGSAIIIFIIWLGMVLVSGISKKHLLAVFFIGVACFGALWSFGFQDYQKQRIISFIHPLADIRGSGYNAYQSTIAVGSGELYGKGVGYGTQSRLKFLPEYETDFIFAAFAEEWGFYGSLILFFLFGMVIYRILANALRGATNFEILYGIGLSIYFMSHFVINVGMNIGLLPVTGLVMPFMSYGGSHLLAEFAGLGILMGMRRYRRTTHKDNMKNEFVGV
ncbi:MAG: rod shape-determining protein RodA [Candidatus Taylorbacteria bacterium RIFCSPLOWO2_12_FULL_43_20]|uniref:Rod shape-determining protein RodA n=1 Tax=Candidatus Taylorbacteria bacterium RIFCSPLOWO2_12_FULL_43_20 TaxID=1802332 RepID=A0A1G2NZZ7_9BACT|nr:MAG: rod shape-determining protein RodA [Candidatus Taylorbacteria bacterium RIFCSPLOWO2_02_FULL_43_22b]OHA41675.1 MAG: rod shape-determining protein RodA [Candidatus Taylorbacteria bacterium RIFCSPLOWO2_12_FULL_43_20]